MYVLLYIVVVHRFRPEHGSSFPWSSKGQAVEGFGRFGDIQHHLNQRIRRSVISRRSTETNSLLNIKWEQGNLLVSPTKEPSYRIESSSKSELYSKSFWNEKASRSTHVHVHL
jgi:hypothetical protein